MTTPTHDLALARAERDAWQSTCEELHRTIAGRDVEIEAHLGRCEAMKRDATVKASQRDTFEHESSRLRAELAAIRDLVAPGNPQGTVVDAVRAMATGLIESIGARDAAEQARDMARDSRDAAIARAEKAEADLRIMSRARDNATKAVHTLSGLYDDSKAELAKLRAEVAELTVTRDRLLAREHEDGRLHAQLRAELAELRARPVLTKTVADAWRAEVAKRDAEIARLRALGLEACDRLDAVARGARGRDAEEARATADRIRKELTRG